MGLSNTILSLAYFIAFSKASFPIPRASAAINILSGFKLSKIYLKPLPSSPIRSYSDISKLSKKI